MERRLEWNRNGKCGNHALLWVREKGSQADTSGEKINARGSEVEQEDRNIR